MQWMSRPIHQLQCLHACKTPGAEKSSRWTASWAPWDATIIQLAHWLGSCRAHPHPLATKFPDTRGSPKKFRLAGLTQRKLGCLCSSLCSRSFSWCSIHLLLIFSWSSSAMSMELIHQSVLTIGHPSTSCSMRRHEGECKHALHPHIMSGDANRSLSAPLQAQMW